MNSFRFQYELSTGVWTDCNPDASKCTVQIKREGIRRKDTFAGTIDFKGDEYETLILLRLTKYQIKLRVYKYGVLFTSGYIRLFKGKFDAFSRTATFDIASDKENYQAIEGNMEVDYDILSTKKTYGHLETAHVSVTGERETLYYNIINLPSFETIPPTLNGVDCSAYPPPTYNDRNNYIVGDFMVYNGIVYKCIKNTNNPIQWTSQAYNVGDVVTKLSTGNTVYICKLTHSTAQEPKFHLTDDAYWYIAGSLTGNFVPIGATQWNYYTTYNANDWVYIDYLGHTYYYRASGTNINEQPPADMNWNGNWESYLMMYPNLSAIIDETHIEQEYWEISGSRTGIISFAGINNWVNLDTNNAGYYRVGDEVEHLGEGGYWVCIKEHAARSENQPAWGGNEWWQPTDYNMQIAWVIYSGVGLYSVGSYMKYNGYYFICTNNIQYKDNAPLENMLSNSNWNFAYQMVYYYSRHIFPIFTVTTPPMQIENGLFVLPSCTTSTLTLELTKGCRFLETIKYLVSQADPLLTVDIIPANPNFVAPYLLDFSYLSNIIVYDKSDIKYPTSDAAPFEMITLKKYLDIIKTMFKLDWYINEVGGVKYFKLRHPSENITSSVWIDLRNYQGCNFSKNIGDYSATSTLAVKKYGLEFEKSSNADFDSGYQEYDVLEDSDNFTQLSDVCNNIGSVYSLPENFSDFGLCFVACDSSNNVLLTPHGIVNDIDYLNAPLSASKLVHDHWNYSGVYPLCLINGITSQSVTTEIGTYKSSKYDFPLVDLVNIDVTKLVITDLSVSKGLPGFYVDTITQKLDDDFADITLSF